MYEEMEDERPRHYRHLAARLDIESTEMTRELSSMIMAEMTRTTPEKYDEINKQFSEAFPYAARLSPINQNIHDACGVNDLSPSMPYNMPGSAASSIHNNRSIAAQSHFLKIETTDRSMLEVSPAPTPYLSPATTSSDATEPTSPPNRHRSLSFRISNFILNGCDD